MIALATSRTCDNTTIRSKTYCVLLYSQAQQHALPHDGCSPSELTRAKLARARERTCRQTSQSRGELSCPTLSPAGQQTVSAAGSYFLSHLSGQHLRETKQSKVRNHSHWARTSQMPRRAKNPLDPSVAHRSVAAIVP